MVWVVIVSPKANVDRISGIRFRCGTSGFEISVNWGDVGQSEDYTASWGTMLWVQSWTL